MANRESILFAPEISERDLDREVDNVNEQLSGVGEDVPVNFDADTDGLTPAGAGGGGGGGGMGSTAAAYGAGKSGGMASLASKIPKPVAGVTAAAALPIAIAGGVGLGMLSAMQNASARLQTSTSLIGQAWKNVWRPLGNKLDQLFLRDLAMDLVEDTQEFAEAIRNGDWMKGAFSIGKILGEGASGKIISRLVPSGLGLRLLTRITQSISSVDWEELEKVVLSKWPGWPSIDRLWPGWPEIGEMWPGWPSINRLWPGWPSINTEWPGWPSIGAEWPGWPDIGTPSWPSVNMILRQFPTISASALRDAILGGSSGGGGGGDGDGWIPAPIDPRDEGGIELPSSASGASGGRVSQSGFAKIHKDEFIGDRDRLVSELASAVSQSTGGRTRSMDTGGLERRLDRLHDDLRRLESALDVTVQVGREEIGRAAAKGKRQDISDSNPRV